MGRVEGDGVEGGEIEGCGVKGGGGYRRCFFGIKGGG